MATTPNLSTRVNVPIQLGIACPACSESLFASVVAEITGVHDPEADPGDLHLRLTQKIVGLRLEHDCIPKVTR